jgi:hypothetical protein
MKLFSLLALNTLLLGAAILVGAVAFPACGPMDEVDAGPDGQIADSGTSDSQPQADAGPMSDPQCISNIQYGPCTVPGGGAGACTVGTTDGVEVTTCQPCGGAGQVACAHIDPLCGVNAQDGSDCGHDGTCVWHDVNNVTCDPCGHPGQPCCQPTQMDLRTWFCAGSHTTCQNLYTSPGC